MLRAPFPAFISHRVGLLVVLLAFSLPLLIGLGRWDMGNDEAIYSYAVERILETGEWLTPRAIPSDTAFFEKPPLKFWLVAAPMRAGLVPLGDAGMRIFDALFGAAAFVYVYLLGVRLGGALCGICAGVVLFAFSPLVFEHGLRSNNMEAPLVLAYAGGIFHFARWVETAESRGRRRDAFAVALLFTLGFMTKFVAALFLPIVCAAALLVRPGGLMLARERWSEWLAPAGVALLVMAPWFVYHSLQPTAGEFWHILFGIHVYTRLTGVLIPEHLEPWHHYVTATWGEFGGARAVIVVTAGVGVLLHAGWRRDAWLARLVVLWFAIPYALMSLGTSKLLHYAYPFIAPLALGAGLACALGYRALTGPAGARVFAAAARHVPAIVGWRDRAGTQAALVSLGLALFALGLWTVLSGPVVLEADGARLFRNSSVVRPLILGALCLWLTARGPRVAAGVAAALVLLALPLDRYVENVRRVSSVNHPIRAIRDCTVEVQRTAAGVAPGVLRATGNVLHHSYYFYMRHTGGWLIADPPEHTEEVRQALTGAHRPVLLTRTQQEALAARGHRAPGVLLEENVAMLLPGPFAACVPRALAVGARPLPDARAGAAARG